MEKIKLIYIHTHILQISNSKVEYLEVYILKQNKHKYTNHHNLLFFFLKYQRRHQTNNNNKNEISNKYVNIIYILIMIRLNMELKFKET